MNVNSARNWPTFTVTLSNGKEAKVTAPSPQRAYQRVQRLLAQKRSPLTVASVR